MMCCEQLLPCLLTRHNWTQPCLWIVMVVWVRTDLFQKTRMEDKNIQEGAKIVKVDNFEKKRKRKAGNIMNSKRIIVDLEEVERLARLEVLGMEDWQDRSSYSWQEKAKMDIPASLKSKKKLTTRSSSSSAAILRKPQVSETVLGKDESTKDIIMQMQDILNSQM